MFPRDAFVTQVRTYPAPMQKGRRNHLALFSSSQASFSETRCCLDVEPQVDDDLSSVVWRKMDDADSRSPIPSFLWPCGKKKKEEELKPVGDGGFATAQNGEGGDDDAAATGSVAFKDYGLLWRMWRVTKPLASHGLGLACFFVRARSIVRSRIEEGTEAGPPVQGFHLL